MSDLNRMGYTSTRRLQHTLLRGSDWLGQDKLQDMLEQSPLLCPHVLGMNKGNLNASDFEYRLR